MFINQQYNCSYMQVSTDYRDAYFEWLSDWPIVYGDEALHDLTGCYDGR